MTTSADSGTPERIRTIVGTEILDVHAKLDAVPYIAQASVDEIVLVFTEQDFGAMHSFFEETPGSEAILEAARQGERTDGRARWEMHTGDMLRWLRTERPETFAEVCAKAGWNPSYRSETRAPWWDEEWPDEGYPSTTDVPSPV